MQVNHLASFDRPEGQSEAICAGLCNGFVMWLDILGFRSLMNVNPDEGMRLWPIIWGFLNETKTIIDTHHFTDYQRVELDCSPECFGFTSFSDSIVASIDLSRIPDGDKNQHWHATSVFLRKAAYLCRKMFEFGLPLRGGISYGEYYHQGGSFAGKPFVEAEELSGSLELSACAFTSVACLQLDRIYKWVPSFTEGRTTDWFDHDCQVKDSNPCKMRVLDFYCRATLKKDRDCADFPLDLSSCDLESYIRERFESHGKTIEGSSVLHKIKNTTQLLEHARSLRPGLFG